MKSKKIDWPITLPKKSAFAIDTPPDINKLHCLMLLSGKRGGGKSVAVTSYVKKLLDLNLMQRCLLITPTFNSNKEIFAPLKLDASEDVLEPSIDVLRKVISIVEEEKKEYDKYWEDLKRYKQFQLYLNSNTPIEGIPTDLLMMLMDSNFEPPKYKYPCCIGANPHPPRLFLIIDDCMGTDMFKPRAGLVNFCIKHRHIADGLGISVAMLVQSYCAIGGVPRPIRENCTCLCLFKSAAQHGTQLEKIHSEIGTDVNLKKFDQLFSYATSKPFGFLFVDFNPKEKEKQFRSGFDEFISL